MAATGAGMVLFAIVHMVGNLQVFLGPAPINHYGHMLKSNPEVLWPVRTGLLVTIVLHFVTAAALWLENRGTRDQPYSTGQLVAASLASRTMIFTGLIVGAFVVYHLLHFTIGVIPINLTGQDLLAFRDAEGNPDVHRMIVTGFQNPWVAGCYLVGVGLLCFHLSHGAMALYQSLGLRNDSYAAVIDQGAKALALVLFLGYVAVPVAVWLRVIQ